MCKQKQPFTFDIKILKNQILSSGHHLQLSLGQSLHCIRFGIKKVPTRNLEKKKAYCDVLVDYHHQHDHDHHNHDHDQVDDQEHLHCITTSTGTGLAKPLLPFASSLVFNIIIIIITIILYINLAVDLIDFNNW